MRNKKIIGEWGITVLLTGVILLLAVPLLLGAGYTYPAADDFIFENGSMEWANALGPVRGPLLVAWHYYHFAIHPFRVKRIPHYYGNALSILCTLVVFYGKWNYKLLTTIGRDE